MQFILDNLIASIALGIIFSILVHTNQQNQASLAETTSFYILRKQQLSFVETLKRDLQNVTELESIETDPATGDFRFYAHVDTLFNELRLITYRLTPSDTRDSVQLYEVQRYEQDVDPATMIVSGPVRSAGNSLATLTEWSIEARNQQGVKLTSTAQVSDARQIHVQFAAAPVVALPEKLSARLAVTQARWESTFWPPSIQKKKTI